jgi:hypothetical protein
MSLSNAPTIKLSRGSHPSPRHGICVMELASLLAGERFSDHPLSVCPVIGSLMRSYNDAVEDDCRQELYPYSARLLGTRASAEIAERRAEHMRLWMAGNRRRRPSFPKIPGWLRWSPPSTTRDEWSGNLAVRSIRRHTPETHASVLRLIDELIEIGRPEPPARPRRPTAGDPARRDARPLQAA